MIHIKLIIMNNKKILNMIDSNIFIFFIYIILTSVCMELIIGWCLICCNSLKKLNMYIFFIKMIFYIK